MVCHPLPYSICQLRRKFNNHPQRTFTDIKCINHNLPGSSHIWKTNSSNVWSNSLCYTVRRIRSKDDTVTFSIWNFDQESLSRLLKVNSIRLKITLQLDSTIKFKILHGKWSHSTSQHSCPIWDDFGYPKLVDWLAAYAKRFRFFKK